MHSAIVTTCAVVVALVHAKKRVANHTANLQEFTDRSEDMFDRHVIILTQPVHYTNLDKTTLGKGLLPVSQVSQMGPSLTLRTHRPLSLKTNSRFSTSIV